MDIEKIFNNLPLGIEPHFSRYKKFIKARTVISNLQRESGFELHHIHPVSLGGNDSSLVKLTMEEHFIAHLILWKCYGGSMGMAFFMMCNFSKYSNKLTRRQYSNLRIEAREKQSNIRKNMIGEKNPLSKKVICLETKEIFDSAKEIQRNLGINHSKISACCRGKRNNTAGFHWRFLIDYDSTVSYDLSFHKKKVVRCLETNEIFESITQAQSILKIDHITRCCKNSKYTSGTTEKGEKRHWEYI